MKNKRIQRSHVAGSGGHNAKSSKSSDKDQEERSRHTSLNNFIVQECFLGALLWNTLKNAERYDEYTKAYQALKGGDVKERVQDRVLDASSQVRDVFLFFSEES